MENLPNDKNNLQVLSLKASCETLGLSLRDAMPHLEDWSEVAQAYKELRLSLQQAGKRLGISAEEAQMLEIDGLADSGAIERRSESKMLEEKRRVFCLGDHPTVFVRMVNYGERHE
eukprot:s1048_g23.t1